MTKLVVETPEGVEIRQDLAGAGSRTAAAAIDGLIFLLGAVALGLVFAIALQVVGVGIERFLAGLFFGGIVLLGLAYTFCFHAFSNGQTPGKKLLGIRVTSADGSPAPTLQHLLRSLILLVDALPLPIPLGLLLAAVTPRHTRLGDLAAGTLVLRIADAERAPEPWTTERWSTLAERRLALDGRAAALLDARDLAFLRDVVTRREIDEAALQALLARVVDVYCAKLSIAAPPLTAPAVVVRELYLFAREHAAAASEDAAFANWSAAVASRAGA